MGEVNGHRRISSQRSSNAEHMLDFILWGHLWLVKIRVRYGMLSSKRQLISNISDDAVILNMSL